MHRWWALYNKPDWDHNASTDVQFYIIQLRILGNNNETLAHRVGSIKLEKKS